MATCKSKKNWDEMSKNILISKLERNTTHTHKPWKINIKIVTLKKVVYNILKIYFEII